MTTDENNCIILSLEFGCTVNIVSSTLTPTHALGGNPGVMNFFAEKGISFDVVLDLLIDTLGESNIQEAANEICLRFSQELERNHFMVWNLDDKKIVNGKFFYPLAKLEYGVFYGKYATALRGIDEFCDIIVAKIGGKDDIKYVTFNRKFRELIGDVAPQQEGQ